VFGAWTTDPARAEPAGRILAATPPGGFDQNGGESTTETTAEDTTPEQSDGGNGGGGDGGDGGGGEVPVDELWEMEELVVSGGFEYFVRMFGQGPDGEVYVLANQRGVPSGDTGAVFELVPPGEGDESV